VTDYEITDAMIVYGGHFVSKLGRLFRLADEHNQAKLKAAFPEYWREYATLAELKQRSA
jgi:hypothetical protein